MYTTKDLVQDLNVAAITATILLFFALAYTTVMFINFKYENFEMQKELDEFHECCDLRFCR